MLVLDVKRTKEDFIKRMGKSSKRSLICCEFKLASFEKFCLKKYNSSTENVIKELIIVKNPQEQVENVIQNFVDELELQGKPYSTVLGYSSLAKNYLKFRRVKFDKSELQDNLAYKSEAKEELYPISKDDIQTLLDHSSFIQKAKIFLQTSGGFRISELMGLRKCDINKELERYTAYIRPKYAKNQKARTTIISIEAMRYVDKLIENKNDDDLLFPHNADNIRNAIVSQLNIFDRLRKRAGLEMRYEDKKTHKITTHSFRAFFVSQFEKTSSGFGHALSGHDRYLKQYERFTIGEKIEKYIETEKYLLIYEKPDQDTKAKKELSEIKAKLERIDELLKAKGIDLQTVIDTKVKTS